LADGAVALVTLAKPPHNLIDVALTDGVVAAYERVAAGQKQRCILLRSAVRHFCAGTDVNGFTSGAHRGGPRVLLDKLGDVPIPTIVAVHAALGGWFELALDAEILSEHGIRDDVIADLKARRVLLSRRSARGVYN
jgi:enoyl-CoA hydratase/carnithine racemase